MITSAPQQHDEDEDLDLLRKIAMESLKKGRENDYGAQENKQPQPFPVMHQMYPEQNEFRNNGPFAPIRHQRMPGMPNYMRPQRFMNNFPPRHAVRPFIPGPAAFPVVVPQPPMPIIHDYPVVVPPIPHVNPQFLAQQQPPPPQPMFQPINDFPPTDYVPTPTVRLSPRSAEFIAANEQAIKKANSRRYSRSPPPRRRNSPIRRKSRSKSPYRRRSPVENSNRKRYRSRSPENRVYKARNNSQKRSTSPKPRKSKSPHNKSDSRHTRKFGNGRHGRKRSDSDKEDDKPQQRLKDEAVKETVPEKVVEEPKKEKSPSPVPEEKSMTPPIVEKKVKTEQELEDELLASTDEEDGLDINMDENELDFLEDDSESENEGRFKSKPSNNVKSTNTSSLPSKSSYGSRSYDNRKSSYSSSRHDYNRRDDKYSSKRKSEKSPDMEPRKKSPNDRKPIVLSKQKEDSKESEKKPLFKSTFKTVDSGEKRTTDSSASKKSERVSLVRSFVSKPDSTDKKLSSSVKSVIAPSEDSSKSSTSSSSKKKIMERLGEFVGVKGKITDGNRSRASKQVFDRRRVMLKMNIGRGVDRKSMASRNTSCST